MLNRILAPHPTIYKWDRTWIGCLLGLIAPFAGILIVYLVSVSSHYFEEGNPDIITFQQIISSMKNMQLLMRYLSVGCMLNLGVFYLFINRDYFNVSRGIIFSTMLIAIPVIAEIMMRWFQ